MNGKSLYCYYKYYIKIKITLLHMAVPNRGKKNKIILLYKWQEINYWFFNYPSSGEKKSPPHSQLL